jgi:predicted nucleotidyltransferase
MKENKTGLKDSDLKEILRLILKYPEIEEVKIFGSRAKGTYKKGSDLDLCISGKNLKSSTLANLSDDLNEESLLPYYFDLLDKRKISSEALLAHIKEYGIDLKALLK